MVDRFIPPRNLQGAVYQAFVSLSKYLAANLTPPVATDPIPTGSITMFGGTLIPPGWLFCQGQAVSRTTYADLFAAIGTTWGAGDGSTTFNVPDLRGRAPIGVGTGSGLSTRLLASTGGSEVHTLSQSEMPSHTHPGFNHDHGTNVKPTSTEVAGYGLTPSTDFENRVRVDGAGDRTGFDGSAYNTGATGGGSAHNNMQPWAGVNFIIKAT
jgi:microcystin-dependent protein